MKTEEYTGYSHGNASASALPKPPAEILGNPKTVFISYSTKNPFDAALVCGALEKAGMRYWVAPRDLLAGTNFADNIEIALGNAKMMVLILSHHSAKSPWVEGEINTIFSAGKPILIFRIDDVELAGSRKLMLGLAPALQKTGISRNDRAAIAENARKMLAGEPVDLKPLSLTPAKKAVDYDEDFDEQFAEESKKPEEKSVPAEPRVPAEKLSILNKIFVAAVAVGLAVLLVLLSANLYFLSEKSAETPANVDATKTENPVPAETKKSVPANAEPEKIVPAENLKTEESVPEDSQSKTESTESEDVFLTLDSRTQTVTVPEGTSQIVFPGNIGGAITKDGAGTMVLTRPNNCYRNFIIDEGTLDLNGASPLEGVVLNGGTLKNDGKNINPTDYRFRQLELFADSKISGTGNFGFTGRNWEKVLVQMHSRTLTKTGKNEVYFYNTKFEGGGKIKIEEGAISLVELTRSESDKLDLGSTNIEIAPAGTLKIGVNESLVIRREPDFILISSNISGNGKILLAGIVDFKSDLSEFSGTITGSSAIFCGTTGFALDNADKGSISGTGTISLREKIVFSGNDNQKYVLKNKSIFAKKLEFKNAKYEIAGTVSTEALNAESGTLAVAPTGTLDLSGTTITLKKTIENAGTVKFSKSTIVKFPKGMPSGKFVIVSGGKIEGWENLSARNFPEFPKGILAIDLSKEGVVRLDIIDDGSTPEETYFEKYPKALFVKYNLNDEIEMNFSQVFEGKNWIATVGRTEVTQEQWNFVMGKNPSYEKGNYYPVNCVSWNDAMTFCKRLTKFLREKHGLPKNLRVTLPTSAQWEFFCRAGTLTKYYTGNDESDLEKCACYRGNSIGVGEVGELEANNFGLFDMIGNVSEWCLDELEDKKDFHVIRGGNFNSTAKQCEVQKILSDHARTRSKYLGFRVIIVEDVPAGTHKK